eukprot:15364902-Ditylum_brightwellii.AAC.1
MTGNLPLFIHVAYFPELYDGVVVLGDGKPRLKMKGIGTIQIWMQNKVIRLKNVLYVLELADTLLSMILCGTCPNCFFVIKEGEATLGLLNQHKAVDYCNNLPSSPCNTFQTNVKLMHNDAIILTRQSEDAAGYDLYSAEEKVIQPHSQENIETGITVLFLPNTLAPSQDAAVCVPNMS